MLTPKVEPLPPVTVEFLRIVHGVEAVRLQCEDCKTVHIVSWADTGLADSSHFPPPGRLWRCGLCGQTDITATPEWPVFVKDDGGSPLHTSADPKPEELGAEDAGLVSPELRDQLQAALERLVKAGR